MPMQRNMKKMKRGPPTFAVWKDMRSPGFTSNEILLLLKTRL